MGRFFRRGLSDIESRVHALTAPAATRDRRVLELVSASAIARRADGAILKVRDIFAASRASSIALGGLAGWRSLPWPHRRFSIGLALVTAAVVNIAATVAFQSVPGWMWSVIPVTAGAIGAVMMVTANAARAHTT
jgi:hypothetical protein